jgi:hypothetical protein
MEFYNLKSGTWDEQVINIKRKRFTGINTFHSFHSGFDRNHHSVSGRLVSGASAMNTTKLHFPDGDSTTSLQLTADATTMTGTKLGSSPGDLLTT